MARRFHTLSSISSLHIRRFTVGSTFARSPAAPLPQAHPGAMRSLSFHGATCGSPSPSSLRHAEASRPSRWQPFQVRMATVPAEALVGFDQMAAGTRRKYYMLGGKGGVGKTSCAASLAVRFANQGHPTIVVSTDPAHSLSDSFAQDLSGGVLVTVDGVDSPLFALEINPEKAKEEFRNANQRSGGAAVKDFMDGLGLGMLAEQVMAVSESSRLCASLRKISVPVKRMIVNQVLPPSASDCKFCAMRRKDQDRALDMIQKDSELRDLSLIHSPLVDAEIRGVPALRFMGEMLWK